jgi:hypothetical protein
MVCPESGAIIARCAKPSPNLLYSSTEIKNIWCFAGLFVSLQTKPIVV